jgi:rubredoxin
MAAKVKIVGPPKCHLCGDTGRVYRAYVEPDTPYQRAKDKVECPRCNKPKESASKNEILNNMLRR